MSKIALYVLALVLIGSALFVSYQARNAHSSKTVVTIGYRAHDLYAPLFIGMEKGFFAKENLTIEAVKFESTNQLTDALLAGKVGAILMVADLWLLRTI